MIQTLACPNCQYAQDYDTEIIPPAVINEIFTVGHGVCPNCGKRITVHITVDKNE